MFDTVFSEIAALLIVAALVGSGAIQLRQPLIVAFIGVGILVGPGGLDWVHSADQVDLLAKLGIALLLFVVGLKLDLHLIRTFGSVALATGLGQVIFTSAFGYLLAIGLGLTPVDALYVHHGLAKGALFLGVGVARSGTDSVWPRRLILAGLVFLALALAGAPFTSGAVAKLAFKEAITLSSVPGTAWLLWLLPLATVGTTLLMGRFVFLVWAAVSPHNDPIRPTLWWSWVASLTGVVCTIWFFPAPADLALLEKTFSLATLWPVLAGIFVVWSAWQLRRLAEPFAQVDIPPGDVLAVVDWLGTHRQPQWGVLVLRTARTWSVWLVSHWQACHTRLRSKSVLLVSAEARLRHWPSAGRLFLFLTVILLVLLAVT